MQDKDRDKAPDWARYEMGGTQRFPKPLAYKKLTANRATHCFFPVLALRYNQRAGHVAARTCTFRYPEKIKEKVMQNHGHKAKRAEPAQKHHQ